MCEINYTRIIVISSYYSHLSLFVMRFKWEEQRVNRMKHLASVNGFSCFHGNESGVRNEASSLTLLCLSTCDLGPLGNAGNEGDTVVYTQSLDRLREKNCD